MSPDGDAEFVVFWNTYPPRNGRRLGKQATYEKWRRLSQQSRAGATAAAAIYSAAVVRGDTIAKDPERFLKSGFWKDWLDPAARPPDRPVIRERGQILCGRCGDTGWVDAPNQAVDRCPDCSPAQGGVADAG